MLPEGLQFASRFDHVTGSAIREIFKVLTRPNMISFAGGSPSAEALPDRECAEIARQVLLNDGKRILQYGATEGYPPFVESLISYLKEHYGFEATPATVLPTTGSTSCMDLLCKAFINPGDTVLVESPTFLGNMQTLRLYEANLVSIPSDDHGVRIDALEEAAKRHHPKLFYVIPCFQNPSGRTLSLERRQQIAELAAKYHFFVMEDDPYRDLRYAGEQLPTIKSFDKDGYVAYCGSFSKIVSPGLRLGYIYGQEDVVRKCAIGKQGSDLHTSNLTQAVVDRFLRQGLLEPHIQAILPGYRDKLNVMADELEHFPAGTKFSRPEGGLFLFAELPEALNVTELFQQAVERGVAYVPGSFFYPEGGHHNTLRLNFSNSTLEQIHQGMTILRELFNEALQH